MSAPTPPAQLLPDRLRLLDALRGLAALYVVFGHARYLLHEGLKEGYHLHPDAYGLWGKITVHALGIFGWGHEAVILFFVLSGFSIHLRYARENAGLGSAAQLNLPRYLWRRGKRLYPPLLLALGLTWGLDSLAAAWHWAIHPSLQSAPHDPKTLLGNLIFAMDNWGSTPFSCFGTDTPLWSLRYEAAFYLLYPVLWLINRRHPWITCGVALVPALVFALCPDLAATAPGLLRNPLELLPVWWLGGLLADIHTGRIRLPLAWLAGLALLLPLGIRFPGNTEALIPQPYATWLLGLAFFGVIAGTLAWHRILASWRGHEMLGKLGDCSYTLYVIHMPILAFIGGWLMSRNPGGHLPVSPIWVVPGVGLCILLAWLAHYAVEKPFMGGRKKKEPEAPQ